MNAAASKCIMEGIVLCDQSFKDGFMVIVIRTIGSPRFHFNLFEFQQANDKALGLLVESSIALSDQVRVTIVSNDAVGKGVNFCDKSSRRKKAGSALTVSQN